jgi:hypothetical protein
MGFSSSRPFLVRPNAAVGRALTDRLGRGERGWLRRARLAAAFEPSFIRPTAAFKKV